MVTVTVNEINLIRTQPKKKKKSEMENTNSYYNGSKENRPSTKPSARLPRYWTPDQQTGNQVDHKQGYQCTGN
jgi:hypothetical protein